MQNLIELLKKNRSYRRFFQEQDISTEELKKMVEAARLSPSSRNVQPLKYFISNDRKLNSEIFPTLGWAGYLTDWDGPEEGERPSAYIIQIHDKNIAQGYSCDHGITAQSILLQAVELGYGGCIIASVKREALSKVIPLPENMEIVNVIALGKPKETVILDEMENNNFKYWREPDGKHHVPKRKLSEIILSLFLLAFILFTNLSCAPKQGKQNPYGLDIVATMEQYNASVSEDPDNELIDLEQFIPGIVLDIRYADTCNFTHTKIYTQPKAYLRRPAAEALLLAQQELAGEGLGFKIYDAYRPYQATLYFYEVWGDTTFVADPRKGSIHNRGCAVDLSLINLNTGEELNMPTPFDEFSERAGLEYTNLPEDVLKNRQRLVDVMVKYGFDPYISEWWHFNLKGRSKYKVMDIAFEEM